MFLDMPLDISQALLAKRYEGDEGKKDLHERDLCYLEQCRETALYAAKEQNWHVISCGENGKPFSRECITDRLLSAIKGALSV